MSGDADLSNKQQARITQAAGANKARLRAVFTAQNLQNGRNAKQQRQVPARRRAQGTLPVPRVLPRPGPYAQHGLVGPRRAADYAKSLCDLWDPLCPKPIPSAFSDGHAHPVVGMRRVDITVNANDSCIMAVSGKGGTPLVGCIIHYKPEFTDSAGTLVPKEFHYTTFSIPTLAGYPHDGAGPTSGRAMKAGLYITNTTNTMDLGGSVYVLNTDQRLTTDFRATDTTETDDAITGLFGQVINNTMTRHCSGRAFSSTKGMFSHPIDTTEYCKFVPWEGEHTGGATDGNHSQSDATEAQSVVRRWLKSATYVSGQTHNDVRPMSTVWALIDRPPKDQTYTIAARGAFYTRWPAAHVLGQHRVPIPTVSPGVLNSILNAGEDAAALIHDVEAAPIALARDVGTELGVLGPSVASPEQAFALSNRMYGLSRAGAAGGMMGG